MVSGVGINDMERGWTKLNEENQRIYNLWSDMIKRCYNKNTLEKNPAYKDCSVCDRWLYLSNFAEDVKKLDGYDKWLAIDDKYEIDKDIRSGGKNKIYCLSECQFVEKSVNIRDANNRRDYSSISGKNSKLYGRVVSEEERKKISEKMKGENNVWYGRKHTEEEKEKIRKSVKRGKEHFMYEQRGKKHRYYGKKGSEHPASKPIVCKNLSTDEENEFLSIKDALQYLENNFNLKIDNSVVTKICKYNENPTEYAKNHKICHKSSKGYTFYYKK